MNEENKVKQKIEMLVQEFRNNPDKFLTEEDMRSYLYHLLLNDFNILQNCFAASMFSHPMFWSRFKAYFIQNSIRGLMTN